MMPIMNISRGPPSHLFYCVFMESVPRVCFFGTLLVHFWYTFSQNCTKSVPKVYFLVHFWYTFFPKLYQKCTKSVQCWYTFCTLFGESVPKVYQKCTMNCFFQSDLILKVANLTYIWGSFLQKGMGYHVGFLQISLLNMDRPWLGIFSAQCLFPHKSFPEKHFFIAILFNAMCAYLNILSHSCKLHSSP